jgi:bacteriorhodopsin
MIYASGIVSLFVQFVIGIVDYVAINLKTQSRDELLKDLLKVELAVQIVEFIFYIWLIYYFSKVSKNITPFRYVDWSITTPLMLITLSAYLQHNGSSTARLSDFVSKHKESIVKIVVLNASMLLCGLMGELGYLPVYAAVGLGFIPFVLNFKHIKDTFLPSPKPETPPSPEYKFKNRVFLWFVFFWALYGVFATMNYTVKNTGYNILDIFAKNFFGLFLAYVVWSKTKPK